MLLACGLFYRDSRFTNQKFPSHKLQISILQTINIFPFKKLQISILQIISIFPCHKLQIFILFCFENYIKPFNSQDLISTCNSRNCLQYSSCDVSWENLVLDQPIILLLIFFSIPITCVLDVVLKFCCGHLWELKGLRLELLEV